MKKIAIFLAIGLMLCAFSTANATLIGLKGNLSYPDILFNSGGTVSYDATTDLFTINARDYSFLKSKGGTPDNLLTGNVVFQLSITVNGSGNLVGTGTMSEIVKARSGTVTIDGKVYGNSVDVTLLEGTVYAFGWQASGSGPYTGSFDFLINNLSGALVTDGKWPTNVPTGIVVDPDGLWSTGNWGTDFTIDKAKGDKAPLVPEPATMLLLGSGLVGMAAFARRKFKKQ